MSLFLERFREVLKENGKKQKDICSDLGISAQKLSNWKSGYASPNFDDILSLANYFEVSVDYLLGRSDDLGAVTVQSSAPALPEQERQLLDLFRSMTHAQQVRFIAYGEGITSAESPKIKA